jgi:UDP-N-acetylmuramate: L-alanyl-gamma-D-glutamyl-meso-diaminopimelate ligase
MEDFDGAQKRMQTILDKEGLVIIQDFAHAPSKVRSTTRAVRERFPRHHLTAVVELHTFSSLNRDFLRQYRSTMNQADTGIILYLPESSDHKKLPRLTDEEIRIGFGADNLKIVHSREELTTMLRSEKVEPAVFLMMSSGFWGGGHFNEWMESLAAD